MTLDDLLKISSAQWDTLSDAELHKILEPYFKVTRPEFGRILEAKKTKPANGSYKATVKNTNELMDLMRRAGINIPTTPPPK